MKRYYTFLALLFAQLTYAHSVYAAGSDYDANHGESAAGLPQLDPQWYASQIFWLVVMFSVLYFVFSKNVLPALSNILESRHEHIQSDLDMAENLKQEAEDVQASYEKILEEAREKAATLYHDIESDISKRSEERLQEFQDEFAKEVSMTEAKLLKAKKEALEEMNTIAAEIASEAAKKIVGINTDIAQAKDVVKDLSSKAKAA